ncbi:MAG TPA: glycoside hydrolase family 38 C-terminal domain-containing protein [Pseudonocardia sp.]|jgi:alpha-mannosidase|uniref:alpha-mannosidase n=1 Tax=Pseudonocardia sp. TaxID=60912 RepID=UPI002B4B87B9|nr:glycoside hydrolase family 38 C-terminal domain-containing protein [Pseudonocardia sp.]HLU59873.1 glycoside hydrolase family 38 C-terminal domain-containing protein [Pseudonocardia sp.]
MHDDRVLIERRIERILRERLRPAVHGADVPLDLEVWHAPGEPVAVAEALAAPYRPARPGEPWGPAWGTSWFHLTGTVPAEWAGRPVEAVVDLGFATDRPGFSAEALVHRPDGTAVKGLNPYNTWLRIADSAAGGEPVDLYVEAAANPLVQGVGTRMGEVRTAGTDPLYRVRRVVLAVFDEQVWELVQDVEVLTGLMHELPVDEPRRWNILRTLQRAFDALDLADVPGSAARVRALLAPALAVPATASAHRVSAVGHAHIDSAWLWPLRETVRKVARTVSNVLTLMDADPGFVFAMSSAQQWAWMREHRPDIWERMRKKVAEGRLVPVGGMWVESDTNMPGGEALARQFVHGKRFFLDELGVETEEVWLPDSFGYSAALPQLVRLSGARWFLTQKISWSQFNRFPHHTFQWEGLDGTRVFTHFPPVDTYNATLSGAEMAHLVRNFADKGVANRSLVPFGHGDGGGGPTREMLARAARLRDLEGSPRVEIEPPARFFAKAAEDYADPPVWVGELYLETHRGTYTSQAGNKRGNRRSEHLLYEAELWAATAAVRTGHPYPYEQLDRIWKTVLLHQFHDILPGSSIAWVHRESRETYARVTEELETIIAAAQRALAGDPASGGEVVFNAAPHARGGVPARGATRTPGPAAPTTRTALAGGWVLDNGLIRATVDERGLLRSVVDLATRREAIAPGGAGNLLQLHPDLPAQYDAWDVDHGYRRTGTDVTDVERLEPTGEAAVRVVRRFGRSRVTQLISLPPGAGRVDVDTEVDWHETETFLKVAFPLDLRADRSAAETQFGYVHRATDTNTSWEAAKYEICAHRYLHVGEPGFGVALVNDSTYGHDVTRTVRPDGGTTTTVRLSLLRAPRFPDPDTDQGVHRMRFALVPGADLAAATREGYRLNVPERRVPGDAEVAPLVRTDHDGVVVSAVKLADDRSGDVVVRLYEALGARATVRLDLGFPATACTTTDLLERPLGGELAPADGGVELTLRPFQVVTLRFSHPGGERQ